MNRFLSFRFIVFLCIFVIMAFSARAEEIIVTATPIKEPSKGSVLDKSPTSFKEVISTGGRAYGLTDTTDLLKKASSVDLPYYGGGMSPVSLRGSGYQETLVLVDGMRLNPVTGDMLDLTLIPVSEIDSIEVIKGSDTASFGEAAMGGVINIVTKNPTMERGLNVTSTQGSYGYGLYSLDMNTFFNEVGFMLDLTRYQYKGDFMYDRDDGTRVRRLNNDSQVNSMLAKVAFNLDDWDTMLSLDLVDQEKGAPGVEGWLTPFDQKDVEQGRLHLSTKRSFDNGLSLGIKAGRLYHRETWERSIGDTRSRTVNNELDADLGLDLGIVDLGAELYWLREDLSSDDYGIHRRNTASCILRAVLKRGIWEVSLSGRYDRPSGFDDRWTYHSGVRMHLSKHLDMKANVGTAYHEPTMGQLYAPSSYFIFIQNPSLGPEKSFSWDMGPEIKYGKVGLGADYFFTRYKDMIKMDYPGPGEFTYVNLAKTRSRGIEAYAWVRPVEMVKISANYTNNNFRYGSGEYESKRLKQRPSQIANVLLDLYPRIYAHEVDVTLAYQFREGFYTNEANTEKTGNRNLFDAGFTVKLSRDAFVSFKVRNIFDDTHTEYRNTTPWGNYWFPVPGRTYRFSMHLKF